MCWLVLIVVFTAGGLTCQRPFHHHLCPIRYILSDVDTGCNYTHRNNFLSDSIFHLDYPLLFRSLTGWPVFVENGPKL